ncbi:vicilin-like seed storage protein [Astyanax mexicanus]|uniref:Vicilin-like seed storage protein n=1 Tax=Astyanax mexicanus TaxID=7994 RepID=A0A8T2LK08_ASTMX|nr:vicilin-like seed storage protein [Astyanax mexicanus]
MSELSMGTKEQLKAPEQKARYQVYAIDDEEQTDREQLHEQLYWLFKKIEARRKSEEMAKMPHKDSDRKYKITLEFIKKAQLEELRQFEEQQRAIRAWYQVQLSGYLEQLKVKRAQAEQKLKLEREALASWREKERRALEIKREKIKEADRKFEERRIAYRQKLEEKRVADAQKRANRALAAAQKRKEAALAEERKREEQRLELERKKEQKRRQEEERKAQEELMAEERKLQEQIYIKKRKKLEAQAELLSQRMQDYILQARLEQEEQMKAVTIADKWKHMQSVVFKKKEAKTRWQKAKISVMVGARLKTAIKK